jgi:hypothetical protein
MALVPNFLSPQRVAISFPAPHLSAGFGPKGPRSLEEANAFAVRTRKLGICEATYFLEVLACQCLMQFASVH